MGTNFTNDLYDHLKGSVEGTKRSIKSFSFRINFCRNEMKWGIFIVFFTAFILGLYLVYSVGLIILWIEHPFYPCRVSIHRMGHFLWLIMDLVIYLYLSFLELLELLGTYYLHLQQFTFLAFLISLPVGALITNILIVNNYRDIEEDKTAGKKTLAVITG
ncbi:MAG: prenyltransferase [Ignavibacteriales bacterium]|nr:prenyltransferase [Ignavibacteriales bacterium]